MEDLKGWGSTFNMAARAISNENPCTPAKLSVAQIVALTFNLRCPIIGVTQLRMVHTEPIWNTVHKGPCHALHCS